MLDNPPATHAPGVWSGVVEWAFRYGRDMGTDSARRNNLVSLADPDQRHAELQARLAELDAARDAVAAAQARLGQARDETYRAMRGYGVALVGAGQPFPLPVMRQLYWDHPEIAAEEIAHSFGLRHSSEVARTIGTDTRTLPCRSPREWGCQNTVTRSIRSRKDAISAPARWNRGQDPRCCPDCQVRAREEHRIQEEGHQRWQAEREVEDARERAALDAAIAAGLQPSVSYVEYPGFHGAWRVDDPT